MERVAYPRTSGALYTMAPLDPDVGTGAGGSFVAPCMRQAKPNPETFTWKFVSTSRFVLFSFRWMMGGRQQCSEFMAFAASSTIRLTSFQFQVRPMYFCWELVVRRKKGKDREGKEKEREERRNLCP